MQTPHTHGEGRNRTPNPGGSGKRHKFQLVISLSVLLFLSLMANALLAFYYCKLKWAPDTSMIRNCSAGGKGRELADMMERRKVDILCVQETRWKGSKARSIGAGFKLFYYGVDSKRNGVGVVLKEEFVRNVLEVKRVSDRVMSLKLEIEGVMLNVVSGYAPQVGCELEEKERFWSELDEVMESIPTGERVVIGADFNGHVGEGNAGDEEVMGKFGVKERNLEGQMVVDFAKRMDMGVVNTYFQKREEHRVTYKSGGRRTQVDYILCRRGNLKEISDCKVVVGESVARQHRMVVCRMTLMVCKKKRSETEKKTKWWKLKKEECCEEFRQKLRQALGGQVSLPDDWETTAEVIRETGRKVLGVSSGRRKEDKETWWWNEEVQDSIQRKRLAKKKWDMDRTEENRQEYKELQRRVKREVSKAKQKAYDELYTRLDTREGEKDLYRLARQRDRDGKDVQQVRVIKDRDGRVLTSEESVQRRWKEYFEELMNEENEREKRVEGVNSVEQKVDKIRKDEVRKALKRMKSGKAVGPDDIPVEVWKCLGEAAVEFLANLFNRVLENLEKAYDRVPREELWYCMRKSGVAEKYVRVVQDMYERSRTVVRCAVGQTEEFNVEVGLHQGSALSPFLFAIVMDQLSEEVRQESPWTMMFADDIVICSESREQVDENLERWRFALERRGMKVSRSKTEYMCVNEREGSGTVRLQGEEVKKVQEFKYLGSTVQSNGECGKELKKRVQAGAGDQHLTYKDRVYIYSSDEMNWNSSRKSCQELGGDLAVINSKEEQDLLGGLAAKLGFLYWIGLTDAENEGVWLWIDGTPLNTNLSEQTASSKMWVSIGLIVAVLFVALFLKHVLGTSGLSPFDLDTREPPKPVQLDKKERNKVLKQGFLASRVPQHLDAIVIGSGIGGLSIAVLLTKVGKKVLVLEQHDRAGGCCHTFTEKGFEFDVGIHYIGNLEENGRFRCIVDQLTNGQLQWEPLENPFDHVVLGPPENRRVYPIYSGSTRFPEELKKCFPGEEKAIDEFMRLVKKCSHSVWMMMVLKALPSPVANFLAYTGLANRLSYFFSYGSRSLSEVVNSLTENKELRAVLCYIFGTYGNPPKEASFSMHSLLVNHYMPGAWYPKGGASQIAYNMIPIIEKAGGAVLVRAPVNRILLNAANEAIGVSVIKGQEEVHVHAPVVISDAGIFNTYQQLLPKEVQTQAAIQKQLSMLKHGEGGLSIFLGLNGTKDELGLKAENYWIFCENNLDEQFSGYIKGEREESMKNIPLIFVASPSAKDPTWEQRSPGKSTLTVVSFTPYSWFEEWKDGKVKNRGADYEELKETIINSVLEVLTQIFPKIKDKIEIMEAGTPITNQHYLAAPKGEIYGADHSTSRFTAEVCASIRPQTPIKNLFLTGQDLITCGFAGAIAGAMVCGSAILNRNLYIDAQALQKKLKHANSKKVQ
ncbi:hypothetical protein QTP86_031776 [Hemibagrus guttatus]|nr:hypothetical protein QTP86_031776 [Hemibagrus guttatus]